MKKLRITTPENIEVEYTLADLASRTAACIIDFFVQGIIYLILGISLFLIFGFSSQIWYEYYGWIIGISLLIYAVVSYGYFIVLELVMNGRTIGKKCMGLRTIRSNGQSLELKHSAIRNLFRVFLDNFGVGMVLIFFSKERKRLGDYVASTIVVVVEEKKPLISLDDLLEEGQELYYYISKEEQQLLREYLQRRDGLTDYQDLRQEVKEHFTLRLKELGLYEKYEGFINTL